jgi:hypothetical protein
LQPAAGLELAQHMVLLSPNDLRNILAKQLTVVEWMSWSLR